MKPYNSLAAYVKDLGSTPEEVCQSLSDKKIKGRRIKADSCPIANYLYSVGVEHPVVSASHFSGYVKGYLLEEETPEIIGLFIVDFDDGKYPDLDEEI